MCYNRIRKKVAALKLDNVMQYGDYLGSVTYSGRKKVLQGEVLGLRGAPTYQGKTVEELEAAFHQAVEDYLASCEKQGKTPEKSYRGIVTIRIPPQLHRDISICAMADGRSLNGELEMILTEYIQRRQDGEED